MKRQIAFLLLAGTMVAPCLAQDGDNLLVNGGFEDGVLSPWFTYGDAAAQVVPELAGASMPQAPVEGLNVLEIVVPEAGENPWDSGLIQTYPFEGGAVYTLSAFVKAQDGEMQITLKPERGCCGYEGFGATTFTFGEEWTEFSVTTPVLADAVPEGQITFHVAFSAGTFWMDGVRFYEGEYFPPDFEPGPPLPRPCPIGRGVEVDGADMALRWSNGDTVPNSVTIHRDGELVADIDADPETYVDPDVPPGAYTYELTFDVEGEECEAVVEEVNSCITGLLASSREEGVRLSWTNARTYEAILIKRDGDEIGDVDGDLEEYIDTEATVGDVYTYEVEPIDGTCEPAFFTLDIRPPPEEGENVLVNGGFEDGFLGPWFTYGNVVAQVVEELEGAAEDEDPIEGSFALQLDVPVAGANSWDAGLIQTYPFDGGVIYTLSGFVKAQQGEMQITFKPERGCCGYEGFGATTFTFGEEWTEFSVTTPVLAEPVPEGQITFHIAFTPGVLWMDGIRFYEGEYVPPPDSEPEPQEPAFVRGDVDSSGTIELADPLKLLLFSFAGGGPPDCEDAADVDDDGTFSGVTDAVGILLWLFQGGDPFPTPMPSGAAYLSGDCGADPTADALECEVTATICSG